MKIGVLSVYSYRPHVEQMAYTARLLAETGHEISYLTCDGVLSDCHNRMFKNQNRVVGCGICVAGGLRSYSVNPITSISSSKDYSDLSDEELTSLAQSSVFTIHRLETRKDADTEDFREALAALKKSAGIFYANVRDWISREKLDAMFLFNGRMDLTRATTFACEKAGIPYVTVERPWMGHGLHLTINDNCIAIKDFLNLGKQYADKPLTQQQARMAANMVANRFLRKDLLDWRVYNKEAESVAWPTGVNSQNKPKILITPGSRGEFWGHSDWNFQFSEDVTKGLDALIEGIGADPKNCVLRCHPIWGEYFGTRLGNKSEEHYTKWAKSRGVFVVGSREKADSYSLMNQCDLIVTTGGTAGPEACALGKPVINIGPSRYETMDMAYHVHSVSDVKSLDQMTNHSPRHRAQQSLRYFYLHAARHPQFVKHVRCISPTEYEYFEGARVDQVMKQLGSGFLVADDQEFDPEVKAENDIVSLIETRNWGEIKQFQAPSFTSPNAKIEIQRRPALKWIDNARKMLPRGDALHGAKAKLLGLSKS